MNISTETVVGQRVYDHFSGLLKAIHSAANNSQRLEEWGLELARRLQAGNKLLVAGNGGSAAEAQHFTAEIVGRYRRERRAFPAIALSSETSSVTAIGNDYGFEEVFSRQIRAHGKPGDILVLLTTSGKSENLIRAAQTAQEMGILVWAFTGKAPNPLATISDECVAFDSPAPHVQECQLAAIHAVCETFDEQILSSEGKENENNDRW